VDPHNGEPGADTIGAGGITHFVALALWFLITQTRVGRAVRAATQDREMVGAASPVMADSAGGVSFWLRAGRLGGGLNLPRVGGGLLMDFTS